MCLGLPCEVLELGPDGSALVRSEHRMLTVSLITAPEPVSAGDWVLVHSGFALARLTREDALTALTVRAGRVEGSR